MSVVFESPKAGRRTSAPELLARIRSSQHAPIIHFQAENDRIVVVNQTGGHYYTKTFLVDSGEIVFAKETKTNNPPKVLAEGLL